MGRELRLFFKRKLPAHLPTGVQGEDLKTNMWAATPVVRTGEGGGRASPNSLLQSYSVGVGLWMSTNDFNLALLWSRNLIKQWSKSVFPLWSILKLFPFHSCLVVLALLEQGRRDNLKMFGSFLAFCFKWASQISTARYDGCVSAQSYSLGWWKRSFLLHVLLHKKRS